VAPALFELDDDDQARVRVKQLDETLLHLPRQAISIVDE
jgi:ferredoxin